MSIHLPLDLVPAWERFLSTPKEFKEIFQDDVLFPLQRIKEMEEFHRLVNVITPTTLMEIGADKGGSVWAWCKQIPTLRRVIACEIHGTPYSELFEREFPQIEFLWIPYSSYDTRSLTAVHDWLPRTSIDVLFIDGDKQAFQLDHDLYAPYVKEGGIVALHDIFDSPINPVFNRLTSRYGRMKTVRNVEDYEQLQSSGKAPTTAYEQWLHHWKGASCSIGIFYKDEK